MENHLILIKQLRRIQRTEFYNHAIKLIPLSLFVFFSPLLILDKFYKKDYLTILFLIVAELIFIGIAIVCYRMAKEKYSFKNSRIYQCIQNPELVTEIIVSSNKILFEIKGMEDETIFLKQSNLKSEILANIKEAFGENKIINNY